MIPIGPHSSNLSSGSRPGPGTFLFRVSLQHAARLLFLTLLSGGCSTSSYVAQALDDADLGLSIKNVTASGVWSTGEPGHGLQVDVWAESEGSRYEPNLELELNGAARVCAALARSDRVLEWAYIDVHFFNSFQQAVGSHHKVIGVVEVIVRRETLAKLRDEHAPPSEYQANWRFVAGYKDQPR